MNAERTARALALFTIAAVAIAQLWPGLSHDLSPPIGWDHGSHLGKAILTWNHLLPSLRGWTDLVETGVPLNTVYGPVGLLWVLLFRCLTPWLAWHQTYALAFTGFRVLVGASVYRVARVAGAGRIGAVAGAMVALADQGTHSEGGWFYDVVFGVWPMSLAMCVLFFGIADLVVFVEQGAATSSGRWARARAMVLLGIALFAHQMSLIAIAMLVPVMVLVRSTDGREKGTLRETLARVVPVAVVGGMIAAWWMLPMLGLSSYLDDHGQLAFGSGDLGARMARGEGVWSVGPWAGVLVSLGLVTSVFARGPRRFFAVLSVVATLVYTSGWFLQLDMARWLPPLGRIVFPRMMMISKPLFFALAGVVVSDALARTAPSLKAVLRTPSGVVGALCTAAMLLPFMPEIPGAIDTLLLHRDVTTTATLPEWNDFQNAWQWVREQPSDQFFRVTYVHDGTHLGQASPAYTDRPGHTPGVLVGEAFRNTPDSLDPDALRAINVRYVVWFSPLPQRLSSQCNETARFGAAHVCELMGWSHEVVSDAEGAVHPVVSHLEDQRVVFDPAGARAVVVRRAMAPAWRATADGEEIPITEERVVDSPHLRLMRLAVPEGAHEVVLSYRSTRGLDLLGALLTLLGLGVVVVATSRSGWARGAQERAWALVQRGVERVPASVRARVARDWPVWACVLPFVGLALVLVRSARGTHLAYHLDEARVTLVRGGAEQECTDPAEPNGVRCAASPTVVVQRAAVVVDGRYHSCVTAGPSPTGLVRLTWDELSGGRTLHLGAGISDDTQARGQGGVVRMRARVDTDEVVGLAVPNGRAWVEGQAPIPDGTHSLVIEIEGGSPSQRSLCFDAILR
jgi:hypothetical protein